MGKRTGLPRGRPKGSKDQIQRSVARSLANKSRKVAKLLKDDVFGGSSHDLLMLTYKDKTLDLATRLEAAKAAISYEKPRLSAVQMSGNLTMTHEQALEKLK